MFLGAILIHPTLIQLAADGTKFDVYGIPAVAQNYTSSIIPIILTIWVASYVERFFKKYTPDVLKVFGIPLGTLLIMLPLELCLFGPLGSFAGQYICQGIICLYDVAGPLAVGVVGATFGLLVLTGMHTVLMAFLFMTFPMVGYDAFIIPAIFACSYAGAGVTLACVIKFKDKKKKQLTLGYFITWLFDGLKTYAFKPNNPVTTPAIKPDIIPAYNGGPNSNYILLGISMVVSVVIGFVVMWFMKLDESLV